MSKTLAFAAGIALFASAAMCATAEASQPLDLKAVCRLTLAKNPALSGAEASTAQSQAALRKARGTLLPSVGLRSSYGYITKPTFFGTTPILETNTVTNTIEIVQPIYTGGQLQAAANAADYASKGAGSTQAAVSSQVLTNAAVSYLRALQSKEAVEVAQSSVRSLDSSLDAANKLHDEGIVTKADVLRAEVALTSARAQLISANNNFATAEAALKTAIGLPQSESIELTAGVDDAALTNVESLPAKPRAEVQAASFAAKVAESQLRAARGARAPSVGMLVDFENIPVGAQFPRLTNTVMVGLQARFSVFDGGQTRASIDEAKAATAKARADLDSVNQATEYYLTAARLAVQSARARVETLATQVKSAEESLRVVETGYREGINAINDVLSVETTLTEAKVSKLSADYDLKIAELNLLLAIGQTNRLID